MRSAGLGSILIGAFVLLSAGLAAAGDIFCPPEDALVKLFKDARRVDLRTCQASSVLALRNVVKIPAPETAVLVKTFARKSLPAELRETLASSGAGNSSMNGVTMNGRYIVVIRSGFAKEDSDILNHELVHAYISLASPKPLPFWFQEASAVHFSTDTSRRVYGKPSEKHSGVTEAKVVELTGQYQRKLQSFHFLIERVGKKRFYKWYANAVETGIVDSHPLLGLSEPHPPVPDESGKPLLIGIIVAAMVIVLTMIVRGLVSAKRDREFD